MLNYINYVNNYSTGSSSWGGGTYAEGRDCTGTSKQYRSVASIGQTLRIADTNRSVTGIDYWGNSVTYIGGYTTSIGSYAGEWPNYTTFSRRTTRISRVTTNACVHREADIAGGDILTDGQGELEPATGLGSDGEAVG